MGRPLNKKYFGNRNIGSTSTVADDDIGGEGIADFSFSNQGNYINRLPTVASFPAPSIPTGVQAAGVLHSVALNCSPFTGSKGTGYQIGDILTDRNGTTWRVTKLRVLSFTLTGNSGSQFDGGEILVWDTLVADNWTSPTILRGVTKGGTGNQMTGYNAGTSTYGVWDGTATGGALDPAPTSITSTAYGSGNGNCRNSGNPNGTGATADNNAAGATFTVTYGVEAAVVVSSADYYYGMSPFYTGTNNTTTVAPTGGTGCKLDVGYGAAYLAVTQKGSGYLGSESVTFTTTSGGGEVTALGTLTVTTDTGGLYAGDNVADVKGKNVTTYQENAIVAIDVSDDSIVDIIKQEGARRFKVRTATTTKFLNLTSPDDSTGLFIQATDIDGYDYWVKKISGHKATVIKYQGSGDARFADNTAVHWTFDAPDANSVKIRNS